MLFGMVWWLLELILVGDRYQTIVLLAGFSQVALRKEMVTIWLSKKGLMDVD